jgi:hypothetical protein
MKQSTNTDIRQQEDELFASMAKVRQPLAPDSAPTQQEQGYSQGIVVPKYWDETRVQVRAAYPGLTESDLDELMI